MIGLEDRQIVAQNISKAHTAGARLRLACKTAGIDVRTLQRWLKQLGERAYSLVMLDLGLPDEDGLALLRKLRGRTATPVMVVTGRSSIEARLTAFELGAGDVLTKPFDPRELRYRALNLIGRHPTSLPAPDNLTLGTWRIQLSDRTVNSTLSRSRCTLTRVEFDLLVLLIRGNGRVFSRAQILDAVTGTSEPESDRAIDTIVSRLRRKLSSESNHADLIVTVRCIGYRSRSTSALRGRHHLRKRAVRWTTRLDDKRSVTGSALDQVACVAQWRPQKLHLPSLPECVEHRGLRNAVAHQFAQPGEKRGRVEAGQDHDELTRGCARNVAKCVGRATRNTHQIPGLGDEALSIDLEQIAPGKHSEHLGLRMPMQGRPEARRVDGLDDLKRAVARTAWQADSKLQSDGGNVDRGLGRILSRGRHRNGTGVLGIRRARHQRQTCAGETRCLRHRAPVIWMRQGNSRSGCAGRLNAASHFLLFCLTPPQG